MIALLLDPRIVTVPEPGATATEIESWTNSAMDWIQELTWSNYDWKQLVECTYALMAAGKFPTFSVLRDLSNSSGSQLDPASISRLLDRLADDSTDFHSEVETKYAVDDTQAEVLPSTVITGNAVEIQSMVRSALVCLAVDKAAANSFASNLRILSQGLDRDVQRVVVTGEIELVEPESMLRFLPANLLNESFELLQSPDEFIRFNVEDVYQAGEAEIVKHIRKIATTLSGNPPLECEFHPEFLLTVDRCGIATNGTGLRILFRRCAQVLSGIAKDIPGARLEQVRESEAGGSPGRTRLKDGASAWRLTVVKHGVGWRLNFWHISELQGNRDSREVIQFASVESKSGEVNLPS